MLCLAPLYFTVVFSLKPVANAYTPPLYWPSPFTWDNYRTVVASFALFPRWVFNDVPVQPGQPYHFVSAAPGIGFKSVYPYSTIWTHAADSAIYAPAPSAPPACLTY